MSATITVPRELMEQALKVIERHGYLNLQNALRAALEQPQQDHKPDCSECAAWRKTVADNNEWVAGVARGRGIVSQLVKQQERTCGTCKHNGMPCSVANLGCCWEPRT